MRILILGINYAPELTGIAKYTTEMCEYLNRKGHRIYTLTAFPYYPFGSDFSRWYREKNKNSYRPPLFLNEEINGVSVMRVNFFKPGRPGTLKRIIHESSFLLLAALRSMFFFKRYDVIVCISPPLLLGLVAYVMSRLKRVPFVFHVQDLQPDAAVDLGMLGEGIFTSFLYAIERFIYRKAYCVFTISEGMRNKILGKGLSEDMVKIFYNWADIGTLKPMPKENSFAKRHGLAGKFVVLHAGNMGEKQDMRTIVEAAREMKTSEEVCFLIVGRGVKKKFVEDCVRENDLTNVVLLDVQPRSVLNEMFSSCDVSLIMQGKDVKDIVMPSKVFGPASVRRPLIVGAADDCEISKIAREHRFALTIPPEDPRALVLAINELKNDEKVCESMGENGFLFMKEHRRMETVIDRFEEDIMEVSNKRNG
jgi:colanic acid biosynthesis glycosyl transferase WcaI